MRLLTDDRSHRWRIINARCTHTNLCTEDYASSGNDDRSRPQQLQCRPDMSTPAAVTATADVTSADTAPAAKSVSAAAVEPAAAVDRRSPEKVVAGTVRHVSMPQLDLRPRRQETVSGNRPSIKEQMAYQQRQQHGRSNSATVTVTAADRGVQRTNTAGRRLPVVHGVGGGGGGSGVGAGFKSKLRNSFRSTAKRIRQQQSAIDALAKNSQMLGLHNLQDSPRTMQAQRTFAARVRIYITCTAFISTACIGHLGRGWRLKFQKGCTYK